MEQPHQLSVAVIIPAYGANAMLRACLESVQRASPPPDEFIVVGDSHYPETEDVAALVGARFLHTRLRGGPARARNLGARTATSELLLFLDADVTVPTGIIAQVRRLFAGDHAPAAVFGSYDDEPAADNFLSQYRNLLHHYTHQTAREEASTFWAGCGAIRRELFLGIGGFHKSFRRPAIEDIELGGRLRQAGHAVRLCKELQVKHLKRWSMLSMLRADLLHRAVPWTRLLLTQRSVVNDLNLRTSSRVSTALVCLSVLALWASSWWVWTLSVAVGLGLGAIALNAGFYRFLFRKRGPAFMLAAIPWHLFYFLYGAAGLAIGILTHVLRRPAFGKEGLPLAAREAVEGPQR